MDDALDAQHTLVAPLARLGLRQVPGLERDGLHLSHRDQDLLRGEQLGTVLGGEERRWEVMGGVWWLLSFIYLYFYYGEDFIFYIFHLFIILQFFRV